MEVIKQMKTSTNKWNHPTQASKANKPSKISKQSSFILLSTNRKENQAHAAKKHNHSQSI